MSDIGVLEQLLIVLTATLSIVFLFQKLRLPPAEFGIDFHRDIEYVIFFTSENFQRLSKARRI